MLSQTTMKARTILNWKGSGRVSSLHCRISQNFHSRTGIHDRAVAISAAMQMIKFFFRRATLAAL
jgi:hypothetical protein